MLESTNLNTLNTSYAFANLADTELLYILESEADKITIIDVVKNEIVESFFITGYGGRSKAILLDNSRDVIYILYDNVQVGTSFSTNYIFAESYTKDSTGNYVLEQSFSSNDAALISSGNISGGYIDIANDLLYLFFPFVIKTYSLADRSLVSNINLSNFRDGAFFDTSSYVSTTTPSPDLTNKFLFFLSSTQDNVYKYNLSSNSIDATIAVGLRPEKAVLDKDDEKLYVCNFLSNFISVIDLTNNAVSSIPVEAGVSLIEIDTEHNLLFIVNNKKDILYVLNLDSQEILRQIRLTEFSRDVFFSKNFRKLIVSGSNGTMTEVNTYDFSVKRYVFPFNLDAVSFSQDHGFFYIADGSTGNLYEVNISDMTAKLIVSSIFPSTTEIHINDVSEKLFITSHKFDYMSVVNLNQLRRSGYVNNINSPHSCVTDTESSRIYIANLLSDKISIYNLNRLTKISEFSTPDSPQGIVLYDSTPITTTSTTTPQPFTANLSITSESNAVSETYVTFYGEVGDSISYDYIVDDPNDINLAKPITFNEILFFDNGGNLLNRITVPEEYVINNVAFTLVSNGVTYSSYNFGSGTKLDNYRSIQFT